MNVCLERSNSRPVDAHSSAAIAETLKLDEKFVRLLMGRGLNGEAEIQKFLHPDPANMYDPLLMKGMAAAAERLSDAIERHEKVVVYGDYDADGVCAAAILSLFLTSRGLDVYVHIPNRVGEGYGLNVDSLAKIIENFMPDLIVTCDCGISGAEEVRFALDLGVDVIVTDHHEVSGEIPECVVVDPRQADCGYPFDGLCGAGVALKLVEAIGGREQALGFTDLACVATIADLVPLVDENRLIVQLGLVKVNEKTNLGLSILMGELGIDGEVKSGDVAYKVAPRINAAGRMGDAYRAFELLTSADPIKIRKLVAEIVKDNQRRKEMCDEMYDDAVVDLESEDLVNSRALFLSHPSWEKGITGILAARLAGDYNRPSFVMVKSGEAYKGTCRSIDGINIHELLLACRDCLEEFGGHSQAAGFSILPQNIPAFRAAATEYLSRFPDELFLPKVTYDMELSADEITYDFVRELDLLEPTGNGNLKPLFRLEADELRVAACKNPVHISATFPGGLQFFAFNYSRLAYQLMSKGRKSVVLELGPAAYGGRQVKGIMRACSPGELYINDEQCEGYEYSLLSYLPKDECRYSLYDRSRLEEFSRPLYGTLIIAPDRASYEEYDARYDRPLIREYMNVGSRNNYSRVVVAPALTKDNISLANYDRIVFLRAPLNLGVVSYLNGVTKAEIFLPETPSESYAVSTDRDVFAKYFGAIRANIGSPAAGLNGFFRRISSADRTLEYRQFVFCVSVFRELGIIKMNERPFSMEIDRSVRADLDSSKIYSLVKEKS